MLEGIRDARDDPVYGRHVYSFFFSSRRRHTRFDCDWSSDVCSSDLVERVTGAAEPTGLGGVGGLLSAGARDVVPAIGDAIADVKLPTGSSSIDRRLTPESLGLPSIASVTNGIVIIFKRPP